MGVRKKCPWPEPGTEEVAAVCFPASELAGGEGEVRERLEEIESYSEVVFSRSGAAGRGVGGGAELGAAVADGGGGAPMAKGEQGRVGEHRWRVGKLAAGSVGREEGRRRGLSGGLGGGDGHVGRRRRSGHRGCLARL